MKLQHVNNNNNNNYYYYYYYYSHYRHHYALLLLTLWCYCVYNAETSMLHSVSTELHRQVTGQC